MNNEQKDHSLPSASLTQNGMLADAVQEGNKLIAHFMDEYRWERDPFNEHLTATYHSSWNQLMPVVEKIEKLGFPVCIRSDYVRGKLDYSMEIFSKETGDLFIENDFGYESKIKCVWETVVEFIKLYNSENNKSA